MAKYYPAIFFEKSEKLEKKNIDIYMGEKKRKRERVSQARTN